MELVQLHGAAADAVRQRVEATCAYTQFNAYFAARDIGLGDPAVYRLAGIDDAVLVQYSLTGLADDVSGVLEVSLRGDAVVRTFSLIEYYAPDGTVADSTRFVHSDSRGVTPIRGDQLRHARYSGARSGG